MTTAPNYYPNLPPEELAEVVEEIVHDAKQIYRASGIYKRARNNFNLFYARSGTTGWDEDILVDGELGGSMSLSVNVLKNALSHIVQMVTSHRPAIDPVVVNSDVAASNVVEIAKAVIDERLDRLKDIRTLNQCTRQCPVLGVSYLHDYWDPYAGGPLKQTKIPSGVRSISRFDKNGNPLTPATYKGDLRAESLTLMDVYFDTSIADWENDLKDLVVRVSRNAYDLMVEHPDAREEILRAEPRYQFMMDEWLPSPSFATQQMFDSPPQQASREVWIYYHRRTPAVPDGRMLKMLAGGTVLEYGPLPKWVKDDDLPVHRLCPDPMIGSPHGYASVTSAGGLQTALNIGASSVLTNMSAFSRKLILADKQSEVEARDLTGDLKYLEVNFNAMGQPPITAIDLMGPQGPIIEVLSWLVGQIEQDTGANSIVRGDPKGITAGVAINLYESMALAFASSLEEARSDAIGWHATNVVRAYQANPEVQREVQIIGKGKSALLRDFYGSSLSGIASFTVDPGNPATRTLSMRYNMATALKQDGVPIQPGRLVHLMKTGDWDNAVEESSSQEAVIRAENERLKLGQLVPVVPGDDPVLHMRGHLPVANDLDMRMDPAKLKQWMEHMHQHANQMMMGDIFVKIASGQVPMGPFPPPGADQAHGDTPAPGAGPPAAPPGQQGPPPAAHKSVAPGAKPEQHGGMKPPGAPPVPGIPGVTP